MEVFYPPRCQIVNHQLHESMLEERLKKILNYFADFSHQCEDIYKYNTLWTQLNEIAEKHSSQTVCLLAACTATEICRNFLSIPFNLYRYCPPKNFQDLHKLVAQFLKDFNYDENDNFTWTYNLLRRFAEEELFRVNHFSATMNKEITEEMFINMFFALKRIGTQYDLAETVLELTSLGVRQLIESAGECIDPQIVLREVLLPLVTGTAVIRNMIKRCISYLKLCHFQILCAIITHRVILKEKSNLFKGKELEIVEKAIMLVQNVLIFESITFVLTKEAMNHFHPDHEQITRILSAIIIRYTDYAKDKWEYVELEIKKTIQTMVSRFIKAMTRENFRPYPNTLLTYGEKLLENSPCMDIKFRYFQLFKHYIKISAGEERSQFISVFDKNLSECKPGCSE